MKKTLKLALSVSVIVLGMGSAMADGEGTTGSGPALGQGPTSCSLRKDVERTTSINTQKEDVEDQGSVNAPKVKKI